MGGSVVQTFTWHIYTVYVYELFFIGWYIL